VRVTKKMRDRAITLLLCDASELIAGVDLPNVPSTSDRLVYRACVAVWEASGFALDLATDCLEAAALLRDGWSPGDPVVRRGGGS